MTKLEELNRHMLGLEKAGYLTEEEYATYRNLLAAVGTLETLRYSMSQYDDGEWFLHEGGEAVVGKVDALLEKLK